MIDGDGWYALPWLAGWLAGWLRRLVGRQAAGAGPACGRWLTMGEMYCSIGRMNAQPRLVSRDHIDFGRVWSAACCA